MARIKGERSIAACGDQAKGDIVATGNGVSSSVATYGEIDMMRVIRALMYIFFWPFYSGPSKKE